MDELKGPDLCESRELLELAGEAAQVALFLWHRPTGRMHLSKASLELCGFAEFDGRFASWLGCVGREDLLRLRLRLEALFAARAVTGEYEFCTVPRDNGTIKRLRARSIISYDAEGRPLRVVGTFSDITEEGSPIAADREEAQHLGGGISAGGAILEGVAHDFNNLLSVIMVNIEAVCERARIEEPGLSRRLQLAQRAGERALLLTQRLLALARRKTPPLPAAELDRIDGNTPPY